MNGNMMYEVAKIRIAEQQRAAREAVKARALRAEARGRRAKAAPAEQVVSPVIPDFAHEMFEELRVQNARSGR